MISGAVGSGEAVGTAVIVGEGAGLAVSVGAGVFVGRGLGVIVGSGVSVGRGVAVAGATVTGEGLGCAVGVLGGAAPNGEQAALKQSIIAPVTIPRTYLRIVPFSAV